MKNIKAPLPIRLMKKGVHPIKAYFLIFADKELFHHEEHEEHEERHYQSKLTKGEGKDE